MGRIIHIVYLPRGVTAVLWFHFIYIRGIIVVIGRKIYSKKMDPGWGTDRESNRESGIDVSAKRQMGTI
jgi:hypothetical protein